MKTTLTIDEIAERLNYLADVLIPDLHENISKENRLIELHCQSQSESHQSSEMQTS